ncbi:MAG: HAMP domain-containing protein [Desulfobacter sp.]|nr:MAG: HAMP domain-containing protein [Desulfobacter sp.]
MDGSEKIKFTKSLRFTISTILLVVSLTILLGFETFQYLNTRSGMFSDLEAFSENTSLRMSQYLANPMWAVEKKVIESLMESEMLDKNVLGILVYDTDGKTLIAGKGRDNAWNVGPASPLLSQDGPGQDCFVKSKDIYMPGVEDKKLGSVTVYVTKQFAKKELTGVLVNSFIAIVLLNLILILAIGASLKRLVLTPLDNVIAATENMSSGDLKTPISTDADNEIRILAESLERVRMSMIAAMRWLQKR